MTVGQRPLKYKLPGWKEPVLDPSLRRHSVPIACYPRPGPPGHSIPGGGDLTWTQQRCLGVVKNPAVGGKLPACCVWPRRQMPNVKEGVASSPPGFPRQRSVVQASSARPVACFSTLLLHTTNTVAQDWLILHTLLTLYQQQCIKLPLRCIVACPVLSCCPALANSYYSATMVPQ